MEGLGGRRPNCRRTNSEGTGRQQLVLVLSAGQYRYRLGNQIFDVISTRYSPSNDEGHWNVIPKWSKPTSKRKITLNQCNSILVYTALSCIVRHVMKKHSKQTVQILQNSILNGRMHNNRLKTCKAGFVSVRKKYELPGTQTSYWQSILERGRRWRLGGCLEWTVGLWADVHFQGHRSPGRSHPAPSSVRVIERGDGWPFCRPNKDRFPANGSEPFGNDRHLEPATTCPPSC